MGGAHGQPPAGTSPADHPSGDELESAFARLIGRQPSQEQRERLYRIRDVLGLRSDDALWSIVALFEHYDVLFRAYPVQMAERVEQGTLRSLERTRAAMVAEAAAAHRRQAAAPLGSSLVGSGLALSAVVAFGALCVLCGYEFAMKGRPFWMVDRADGWGRALLGAVLGVPAGWMVFALLLPAAWRGGRFGWQLAGDPASSTRERALGWSIVAACALCYVACAVTLVRVV